MNEHDFKNSKSLYEEQKRQGRLEKFEKPIPEAGRSRPGRRNMRRPKESVPDRCEQWTSEGCRASLEAVKLGLAKTVQPCNGNVPPFCGLRLRLAAGVTVMELYNK